VLSGQLHARAALPQRKSPQYPLDKKLGGPQSRSGSYEEKSHAPAENRTPAVQPVACRYTDWAITSPQISSKCDNNTIAKALPVDAAAFCE
jgi:hypothetical protein